VSDWVFLHQSGRICKGRCATGVIADVVNTSLLQVAFELLGVVAVITNCSLVALSPSVKNSAHGYSDVQFTLLFVAAEVCDAQKIQDIG